MLQGCSSAPTEEAKTPSLTIIQRELTDEEAKAMGGQEDAANQEVLDEAKVDEIIAADLEERNAKEIETT